MQIWERESLLGPEELSAEAVRRNEGGRKEAAGVGPIRPSTPEEVSQSDLPVIWGAGWEPAGAVDFSLPLQSSAARAELLRFLAERHDGHLVAAASCWDGMSVPKSFDGRSFHDLKRVRQGAGRLPARPSTKPES